MTFCNIECWKYTFSLWNIDILAPQMHAERPAGGSPETVPTGTQPSAKNSINPCTKWGGTFRHPINPCIICTFLTPECKKCYKSLHEMHPGLLASRPGKTIDISFSLRQDPLEQALFGEWSLVSSGGSIICVYICIFLCVTNPRAHGRPPARPRIRIKNMWFVFNIDFYKILFSLFSFIFEGIGRF